MNSTHDHTINCSHPTKPSRAILTSLDLDNFQHSPAHQKFIGFIELLNSSIKNKTLKDTKQRLEKDMISVLQGILKEIKGWIDEIPAAEIGLSRFGNPSFRLWYDKLDKEMERILMPIPEDLRLECGTYLLNSFGDRKRIDYGTGHEANFICFLLCLHESGIFSEGDEYAVVSVVFWE